jgi:hypothetical protein
MLDGIGWAATAAFGASYFCTRPATLRLVQAGAAMLWIAYGLLIGSAPVVVSNLVVATLATWSTWVGRTAPESAS